MAEDPAHAFVRINDPQQHPQGGGLARAIRPQNAVDRALRHRDIDAVDRCHAIEPFDQPLRLDRQRARNRPRYDGILWQSIIAHSGGLA